VCSSDLIVLYGATVDGTDLLYDRAGGSSAYLDAPPSKSLSLSAADVALQDGAVVDLSGGGDLQAAEFVAGTGGSTDVLSQTGVYAILPGDTSSLLAAYDPEMASDPLIGQSVHLSGVPGLPEGDYVLLPARYATLPGAFRVVQDSGSVDVLASQNTVLADGTRYVAGYLTDAFSGARDARTTGFFVQSTDAGVWQQYSEYELTSADTFFARQAARAASVLPQLPRDAGRLVIAPTQTLSALDATLLSESAEGAAAQIDIAAAQIQIIADGEAADAGFVGISASDLSDLNAGSLLIGGTRTRGASGDTITAIASQIVVSNGSDTLVAPEILLVAQGVAGTPSIDVRSGSQIAASGEVGAVAPITIGREAAGGQAAVSGDGALLRVSSGDLVTVNRVNTSGDASRGVLVIGADASLQADGGSITLDSSGSTQLDAAAGLSADAIAANSSHITFLGDGVDAPDAAQGGIVLGAQTLAQLASASQLSLNSRGSTQFLGDVSLEFDGDLSLGAALFDSDGGSVSIAAQTLTLGNLLGSEAGSGTDGSGSLNLSTDTLVFAGGDTRFSGFSQVQIGRAHV
jgi:hypothetical protein